MKHKHAILEYRADNDNGRNKGKWGFRFKTADGQTLMESSQKFHSLAQAEQGFIALIKSIVTNQYVIDCQGLPGDRAVANN